MPRMSGFEFLEALEAVELPKGGPPTVVVMLSSSKHTADRERAESFDLVRGYVLKPLTVEAVVALAEEHGSVDDDGA